MHRIDLPFGRLTVAFALIATTLATVANAKSDLAAPKSLSFTTKDGVDIKATYYASDAGEQASTIILLHDHDESRAIFDSFARYLQSPTDEQGKPLAQRAVLAVDLRGHGDSRTARGPRGNPIELEASKFGKQDYAAMVLLDMEAVRKFLVKKNNAKELNLNKLCLIGSGMGANVATIWAARDWSMPNLARLKQGQDVKSLVLFSPRWSLRGLPLKDAIRMPAVRSKLSIFLAFGNEDSKVKRDARTIYKNLEKYHPEPPRDQRAEKQTLYYVDKIDTPLQGTELVTKKQFKLAPYVNYFITQRLDKLDIPWIDRSTDR